MSRKKFTATDNKTDHFCPCLSRPVLLTFQDSQDPKDESRRFILCYYLSNDMINIYEKPSRNSGIIGGKFLEKTQIPKPGSSPDNPEFYSPADFAIGATVEGNNLHLKVCFDIIISWIPKGIFMTSFLQKPIISR